MIDPEVFDQPSSAANERESRRTRQIGETFQPDEGIERLIGLRDRDPNAFAREYGANAVIRCAMYEQQKSAAQQIGMI